MSKELIRGGFKCVLNRLQCPDIGVKLGYILGLCITMTALL